MARTKSDSSAEQAYEAASAAKPAKRAARRKPAGAAPSRKTTKTATAARAAAPQKGQTIMNDTVKKITETAKQVGEDTKARVETLVADANARTRETMEKTAKSAEEMAELSKGNVEAIVESGKIAAEGLKAIGEDAMEFSRKSFEDATAAAKQYAAAKTPADLFKLHGDYVRSSFDMLVAQASKNSEAMLKLAGESFQPLSNRMSVAASKIKTA